MLLDVLLELRLDDADLDLEDLLEEASRLLEALELPLEEAFPVI